VQNFNVKVWGHRQRALTKCLLGKDTAEADAVHDLWNWL
jgi:hypothetical protein